MTREPLPFLLAALGVAAGAGFWWLWQRQQAAPASVKDGEGDIVLTVGNALGIWSPPAKYAEGVTAAETRYGLPTGMLARLLWQESRYREDIITGATRSPAGALGIAQFMPATAKDFGIDPLNPVQAIDAAGKYLSRLYARFGNWAEALAAYNWGQGNVARKGLANAPAETRQYFSSILSDLGLS